MRKEIGGYSPAQVDAFLARCLATPGLYRSRFPLLHGRTPSGERVTPEEIRDVRFGTALLGYPMRAIDALLDQLAEQLEHTTWHVPEPTAGARESLAAVRTLSLVTPSADRPQTSAAR